LFQADPISAFDLSSLSQNPWNHDRFYLAGDNTLWLLTAPNPVKTPDVYKVWRAALGKPSSRRFCGESFPLCFFLLFVVK